MLVELVGFVRVNCGCLASLTLLVACPGDVLLLAVFTACRVDIDLLVAFFISADDLALPGSDIALFLTTLLDFWVAGLTELGATVFVTELVVFAGAADLAVVGSIVASLSVVVTLACDSGVATYFLVDWVWVWVWVDDCFTAAVWHPWSMSMLKVANNSKKLHRYFSVVVCICFMAIASGTSGHYQGIVMLVSTLLK
jgi:hypothetical protein